MTSGDDAEASETDAAPPLLDAAGWRAFFAGVPPREIWRVLQKEKISQARIFAGFRPAPEMLRTNPVVVTRLVDEAVKQPAFAKAVRDIAAAPLPEAKSDSLISAAPEPAAKPTPEPKMARPENDEAKLKELRGAARAHVARIKELETAASLAQHERDAAKAEAASHLAARRAAEEAARRAAEEAERQKRDRATRRAAPAPAKEPARATDTPPVAAAPVLPAASTPPERLLHDAAQRLLQENRWAQVSDLCREAVRLLSENAPAGAGERGRIHALYASALYGLQDAAHAEEQDRLAATAFLDNGDVLSASEAIARRVSQGNAVVRAADVPVLRRLTLLAQKLNQMEAVQAVFFRLRITAPIAFRRLQEASGLAVPPAGTRLVSGGAAFADLLGGGVAGGGSGTGTVGPDETVSLPLPNGENGSVIGGVTPRQLVRAVDSGNVDYVFRVRAALASLRDQNKQASHLVDALLEAVADLSPVAVCPLLHQKTRPVFVDASNVARYNPDPLALETPPRVQNLRMMRDYLLRRAYFPVSLIADANLRYHVDDKPAYLEMLEKHIVRETPPGMSADETLIWEAHAMNAPLVTNDRLSEWGDSARRIERVGFLVSASGISLTPF